MSKTQEQCPYTQRISVGDESTNICEINTKPCLLEENLPCGTYQEFLQEGDMTNKTAREEAIGLAAREIYTIYGDYNKSLETANYVLNALESLGYVQKDPARPKIVCLCGSGRFKDAFEQVEFDETLRGNIVLTIGCNAHDIARSEKLKHCKPMLDELHLRKIDLADEVIILNVGGYIGESTRNELNYALSKNKKMAYLEPI